MKAPDPVRPLLRASRPAAILAVAALGLGLLATGTAPASAAQLDLAGGSSVQPLTDLPAGLAGYYGQTLSWAPCEGTLECSWLNVPLDYANPSGPSIRLRINRVPATGPASARQGSLVINPGGPGGSGIDFTAYVAHSVAPKVNAEFDIVGFDPRGVGRSAPITCMTGRQTTLWLRQDGTPNTPDEERRLMAMARGIANGCLLRSPELATHVGTDNTVRDMDILRQALGDPRLNWLGFSYGTYMGTLYAQAFPDRVGRFVLDGPVDPANDGMQMSLGQSQGFQVAIGRFAADCAARPTCPYSPGARSVVRGINSLLTRLDARPMATDQNRRLSQSDALSAIFYSMYSPMIWSSLRQGLSMAKGGDGSGLLTLADVASERTGPNTYATNMASAFYSISCWDFPATPGAAGMRAAAAQWSRRARVPEMAMAMSWGNAPCSQWYGHTPRLPSPANTTTSAPIVVVGTLYDPATPYPWAVSLSKQLPTSTLLTYNGDGHTAYGSGSACIDRALGTYLLTGTPPAPGTVCN